MACLGVLLGVIHDMHATRDWCAGHPVLLQPAGAPLLTSVTAIVVQEYKIHNAELLFKEDASVDDLIDVIEGNRRYIRCLYVYNKVDVCSIEEVDTIARLPNSVPISAGMTLNMDGLLADIWTKMALVRVYTKRVGSAWTYQ